MSANKDVRSASPDFKTPEEARQNFKEVVQKCAEERLSRGQGAPAPAPPNSNNDGPGASAPAPQDGNNNQNRVEPEIWAKLRPLNPHVKPRANWKPLFKNGQLYISNTGQLHRGVQLWDRKGTGSPLNLKIAISLGKDAFAKRLLYEDLFGECDLYYETERWKGPLTYRIVFTLKTKHINYVLLGLEDLTVCCLKSNIRLHFIRIGNVDALYKHFWQKLYERYLAAGHPFIEDCFNFAPGFQVKYIMTPTWRTWGNLKHEAARVLKRAICQYALCFYDENGNSTSRLYHKAVQQYMDFLKNHTGMTSRLRWSDPDRPWPRVLRNLDDGPVVQDRPVVPDGPVVPEVQQVSSREAVPNTANAYGRIYFAGFLDNADGWQKLKGVAAVLHDGHITKKGDSLVQAYLKFDVHNRHHFTLCKANIYYYKITAIKGFYSIAIFWNGAPATYLVIEYGYKERFEMFKALFFAWLGNQNKPILLDRRERTESAENQTDEGLLYRLLNPWRRPNRIEINRSFLDKLMHAALGGPISMEEIPGDDRKTDVIGHPWASFPEYGTLKSASFIKGVRDRQVPRNDAKRKHFREFYSRVANDIKGTMQMAMTRLAMLLVECVEDYENGRPAETYRYFYEWQTVYDDSLEAMCRFCPDPRIAGSNWAAGKGRNSRNYNFKPHYRWFFAHYDAPF